MAGVHTVDIVPYETYYTLGQYEHERTSIVTPRYKCEIRMDVDASGLQRLLKFLQDEGVEMGAWR